MEAHFKNLKYQVKRLSLDMYGFTNTRDVNSFDDQGLIAQIREYISIIKNIDLNEIADMTLEKIESILRSLELLNNSKIKKLLRDYVFDTHMGSINKFYNAISQCINDLNKRALEIYESY
jgi:hypothetical protein